MKNQPTADTRLSVSDLTEEKAVRQEIIIKTYRIDVLPVKVVTKASGQLAAHKAVVCRSMEIRFTVKNECGSIMLPHGKNAPLFSSRTALGKAKQGIIWNAYRFSPPGDAFFTATEPTEAYADRPIGRIPLRKLKSTMPVCNSATMRG